MTQVFIGLGANLKAPYQQIECALKHLSDLPQSQLIICSSFYQSIPWGYNQEQPLFVNAVAMLESELAPIALLDHLQAIERCLGRIDSQERWGPRVIDLDILLYDNDKMQLPRLTVPHPYLQDRDFVVYPLAEIVPDLILPSGESILSIRERCLNRGLIQLKFIDEVGNGKNCSLSGDI